MNKKRKAYNTPYRMGHVALMKWVCPGVRLIKVFDEARPETIGETRVVYSVDQFGIRVHDFTGHKYLSSEDHFDVSDSNFRPGKPFMVRIGVSIWAVAQRSPSDIALFDAHQRKHAIQSLAHQLSQSHGSHRLGVQVDVTIPWTNPDASLTYEQEQNMVNACLKFAGAKEASTLGTVTFSFNPKTYDQLRRQVEEAKKKVASLAKRRLGVTLKV